MSDSFSTQFVPVQFIRFFLDERGAEPDDDRFAGRLEGDSEEGEENCHEDQLSSGAGADAPGAVPRKDTPDGSGPV